MPPSTTTQSAMRVSARCCRPAETGCCSFPPASSSNSGEACPAEPEKNKEGEAITVSPFSRNYSAKYLENELRAELDNTRVESRSNLAEVAIGEGSIYAVEL